jgi:hypothetical protein
MENLINNIANFIEDITGRFPEIDDNILSYSDRVSPNVTSGQRYDDLVEKVKHYMLLLRTNNKFKNLITVEFEYNDEWVGFRVTVKS